jgi:hypothetical protein
MNFCRFFCLSRRVTPSVLKILMVLPAAFVLLAGSAALAQGTKVWTQSKFEEFEKGTPEGVAISSDGRLLPGPVAAEIGTTPSTFVWGVAAGKDGAVYVGTGSPATVLRVNPDKTGEARFTRIFESKALAVQALRLGLDGALYAATIPDGKVYRIKAGSSTTVLNETTAEVVFDLAAEQKADSGAGGKDAKPDSKARYIWDMTFDAAGRLYVAAGGPGVIYRVDVSKTKPLAEVFFKTDEQHIRTMAWDAKGNLIAGSDGSGLVYRISPEGKGYVLFSAPRREITSVAVGADGTIYAADVGDKSHNPLPQLPVASGGAGITISFVQPGSVQAANTSLSVPEGSEIYAIRTGVEPEQAPRKLWSDKDAVVYRMAAGADGLTVLTGNRGRIYRIGADGTYSDLGHLEAQQAVAMASVGDRLLIGTANTGKLYELKAGVSGSDHAYASDVLDAGALARWGRVEVDPASKGYALWTRSGNVEQPARSQKDWGWSDWQPVTAGKVASPAGRYLQWKVDLKESGEVSGIGVNYLPVNAAPVVDEVVVVPGARVAPQTPQAGQPGTVTIAFANANAGAVFVTDSSGAAGPIQAQKDRTAVTVRWSAHDDNGDELSYDLYLRGDGEHVWRLLKKNLTEKVYSFDGGSFPDGGYQIKVVASDAPSHGPGDALTGEVVSERFEVDTTAPVLTALKAEASQGRIAVSFAAKDDASVIEKAEYSLDAGVWQYVEPVGGLSDSQEERYAFSIPLPAGADAAAEHLVTVRVYDRHENVGTAKVVVGSGK